MSNETATPTASPLTAQGTQQPVMVKRIGKTTYRVKLHFSETSKETMTDKIKRLILNDCAKEFEQSVSEDILLVYLGVIVNLACLVLMLSLSIVAYAANWFGLRDLLLPFINQSSIEEESSTIGLSGYQGSEEWQALAEWREFVSQYDPDGRIYQNIDGNIGGQH